MRASAPLTWRLLAKEGRARAGILDTPHGAIDTPAFMAVATLGGLKGVSAEEAERLGCGIVLANTYHLLLRPGPETVARLGGLHAFAGWRGPMLTDSGGYQVYSLARISAIEERGVRFRSHLDGSELLLGPEESVRAQRLLGADIVMAFDDCPSADADRSRLELAVERSARWLQRSLAAFLADDGLPGGATTQALYGIVQGACVRELRLRSLELTCAEAVGGIAIGGLAVGESFEERLQVLDWLADELPAERPRYLMGVGTPLDLVEAVARGLDQFDCVLPTRMGRHGIAYTDDGPLRLMRAEFAEDGSPIDDATPSPASRHSRGYLRHLLKAGEMLGGVLLSQHNLAYYMGLMARMREHIVAGSFSAFAAAFRERYRGG